LQGCGAAEATRSSSASAGPLDGSDALAAALKQGATGDRRHRTEERRHFGKKVSSRSGDDVGDPKQGGLGRQATSSPRASSCGRALQLRREHAGLPDLIRKTTSLNHAGFDQSQDHRTATCGHLSHPAGGTTSRGNVAGQYIAKHSGQKVGGRPRQTTYGQGLPRDQENHERARRAESSMKASTRATGFLGGRAPRSRPAGADLVYWGGLHTEGGFIVRQMRRPRAMTTMRWLDRGAASPSRNCPPRPVPPEGTTEIRCPPAGRASLVAQYWRPESRIWRTIEAASVCTPPVDEWRRSLDLGDDRREILVALLMPS